MLIHFRADPEIQARIEELARKSTEGELTEELPDDSFNVWRKIIGVVPPSLSSSDHDQVRAGRSRAR